MARLRVVEVAPKPVAKRPVRPTAAHGPSPVLSAQEAWCEKQRKLAEARTLPAATSLPAPTPAAELPPRPSALAAAVPTLAPPATAMSAEAHASSPSPEEPEVWLGPWLPRPGLFPSVAVDVTKLAPFGAPVSLPVIDVSDEGLAEGLASALGELEPGPRLLIERLIGHVGANRARALYEQTRDTENAGGIRVHARRRTSGGIFLSLVERQIGARSFLQASVLAALTVGILPGPPKNERR